MSRFNKCEMVNPGGHNSFGFSTFLTVIECFLYYSAMGLGLHSIHKVHTDEKVLKDPFEAPENVQSQQD
jgi:hypothetical protein